MHKGKGRYIGSHVIVLASDKLEAEMMIRQQLDEIGLEHEEVVISGPIKTNKPRVIDWHDGDFNM